MPGRALVAARQAETALAELAVTRLMGGSLRTRARSPKRARGKPRRRADLQDPALVHHRGAAAERQCLDGLARRVEDHGARSRKMRWSSPRSSSRSL